MTTPPQETSALPCLSCGYDLRGISIGTPCPECGRQRFKGDEVARNVRETMTGSRSIIVWCSGTFSIALVAAFASLGVEMLFIAGAAMLNMILVTLVGLWAARAAREQERRYYRAIWLTYAWILFLPFPILSAAVGWNVPWLGLVALFVSVACFVSWTILSDRAQKNMRLREASVVDAVTIVGLILLHYAPVYFLFLILASSGLVF